MRFYLHQHSIAVLATAVLLLTVSCRHGQEGKTVDVAADSIEWEDSVNALCNQAAYYSNNGLRDSLILFAPEAMKVCDEHNKMGQYYYIWGMVATDYFWNYDFEKGVAEAQRIQEDALSRHDDYGLFTSYRVMGIGYGCSEDFKEASKYLRKAIDCFPKGLGPTELLGTYAYLYMSLENTEQYEVIDTIMTQWKTKLDSISSKLKDRAFEARANWNFEYQMSLAKLLILKKNYAAASSAIDSAEYYVKIGSSDTCASMMHIYEIRSRLAKLQGDYQKSLEICDARLKQSEEHHINSHWLVSLSERGNILEALGRYKEALGAFHEYHDLKDSLSEVDSREQMNELNKRFEVAELKMDAERKQMEAERRQLYLVMAIVLLIMLAFVALAYYRRRNAKRLAEKNAQLSALNAQLTIANARAEESSRMKTNFIQQISHEIRTPLNILSGFTQVVTTPGMDLDDETKADINRQITENTDRITGLVNKMLELSDANSQSVIERSDQVPVVQIAAEAVEGSGIANAKHLDFDLRVSPDVEAITLQTNHQAAVRALTLVLDNARKFTNTPEAFHQNSDMVVEKKTAVLSIQPTTTRHSSSAISFVVEDNGPSIPIADAERIFDEFVQLNEYYDGTGIGLTVARSLARRLGGDINLDVNFTNGARFVQTLPLE